jgi:hypothetical protein
MNGKHKKGYRWPRIGEKRRSRQPFLIDSMSEAVRLEIQKRRAAGDTWQEVSEASKQFAGRVLPISMLHRWYAVRVEQVNREVMEIDRQSRKFAALFKDFKDLPEATINALASQAFNVMNRRGADGFEAALSNLGVVLAKMMSAKAAADRVRLERERLDLEHKRFEELKKRADKATIEAAVRLGKSGDRSLTIDEINRLRERTFGLPPIRKATPEELSRSLDEIYGIGGSEA